jgi:hypothetical protein
MIKQVRGTDGRERCVVPLNTLKAWCIAYWRKHGMALPEDFVIELQLENDAVCTFENKIVDKNIKE